MEVSIVSKHGNLYDHPVLRYLESLNGFKRIDCNHYFLPNNRKTRKRIAHLIRNNKINIKK